MKLNKQKQVIQTDESIPGLMDCNYEYSIKETTAWMDWKGPRIPQELWYQITSFFKWTYDTTKSESQVRLYVSPTLNTWKAWAFPQEARTGMSALEINDEDARRQREELQLNPPDWFYFGTVHHHCSMGAFQSGTDRENEENQDGLHITVGNMDKATFDIHCRFYRKTMKFETSLDMSKFFDIGDVLSTWPEVFKDYMPKDLAHKTAVKMMCKSVETEFPAVWKSNLKEIKPAIITQVSTPVPTVYGNGGPSIPQNKGSDFYSLDSLPIWRRAQNAWKEIIQKCVDGDIQANDVKDAIGDLTMTGFAYNIIVEACLHHKLQLDDVVRQEPNNLENEMAIECDRLLEIEKALQNPKADPQTQIQDIPDERDQHGINWIT